MQSMDSFRKLFLLKNFGDIQGGNKSTGFAGSEKIGYPESMELSSNFFRLAFSNFLLVAQTKTRLDFGRS